MTDKRPGGLTALAVFNFIFGGFAVILSLGLLVIVAAVDEFIAENGGSVGLLYLVTLLTVASAGLLIASGVGYLKQKLFLGRKLGNAYAAVSLTSTVVSLANGGDFGVGTIIFLIYPVLTLALLNGSFKEDLVN